MLKHRYSNYGHFTSVVPKVYLKDAFKHMYGLAEGYRLSRKSFEAVAQVEVPSFNMVGLVFGDFMDAYGNERLVDTIPVGTDLRGLRE